MGERQNIVTLFCGNRNTGKSYFNLQLIKKYRDLHPEKKILIMDTLDHPHYNLIAEIKKEALSHWRRPSIYRIFGSDIKGNITEIQKNVSNALIIFEDASKYISKLMDSNIRTMIFDSKQRNNDLIFMFHGFKATPPELFRIADYIELFKTGDHPATRKNEMVNYEEIVKVYELLKKSPNQYIHKTIRIY